ncbi:MAG TPA: S9 family peptidase [Anaerolineales bacterium]|nr:S9 family peptidase [Anaerolineales bacterium]
MLNLAQLLSVPHVDNGLNFDISHDGQKLVFAWNKTGNWELYEKRLDGTASASPLPVSQKQGSKFSPLHSPDGTMLAYALDFDGSESYHIVVYDLSTSICTDLTPQIAYAHQPNFSWSPDCKMLAVLSDKHGQFALHLLPVDGTPGRMLKNVFHPCWDAKWSPDGQWIAIEAESAASDRSIYVMPVNRPRKGVRVNTTQLKINGQLLNAQHPAWSPDSKFLAFSGENDEWHDIGVFNVETHEITWVNESIGDDTQPAWSQDGSRIGWVHSEGARTSLQFKESGGEVKEIKVGDGVHYFPHFTADSVVILYEDPRHPCDLWKINIEDGSLQQVTNSLPGELCSSDFIQPEEVWYAGKDGRQVPALLYRPKNTGENSPAVVSIHGGPNWVYQFLWDPMLSHMASRGWTVLVPNYRGSTGYGKKWQNASRYDMGGVDTDDCAAAVNYLINYGLADKDKIAVTGRSHGGYLTMTCMTTYPELWAAGSAVVPFLNWLKSHKASREDLQHWNIENMGEPEDNHELWIARSPYFFLDKVNAPVQMICGEKDPRCPASDSLDARDKLFELGREVELLIYKDEGHVFLSAENIIDSEVKRVEFMARALEN